MRAAPASVEAATTSAALPRRPAGLTQTAGSRATQTAASRTAAIRSQHSFADRAAAGWWAARLPGSAAAAQTSKRLRSSRAAISSTASRRFQQQRTYLRHSAAVAAAQWLLGSAAALGSQLLCPERRWRFAQCAFRWRIAWRTSLSPPLFAYQRPRLNSAGAFLLFAVRNDHVADAFKRSRMGERFGALNPIASQGSTRCVISIRTQF